MPFVVRQKEGRLRATGRIGIGNCNHKTARPGPVDARPCRGPDLTCLFKQLSGCAPKSAFRCPRNTRPGLIEHIRRKKTAAWEGSRRGSRSSATRSSMRSASTPCTAPVRPARASTASSGLRSLNSGVPAVSDTIRVHSIPCRFLEHSRVYACASSQSRKSAKARSPSRKSGSDQLTSYTAISTTASRARACRRREPGPAASRLRLPADV